MNNQNLPHRVGQVWRICRVLVAADGCVEKMAL